MGILDLLRRDTRDEPTTAAALREAIATAEAESRDTAARLQGLTGARAAALLDEADDTKLDRIEAEIVQATRHADRIDLAVAELRRRAEQAVADERQAKLDAIHAQGEAAVRRGVELVRKVYPKHARALAAMAEELATLRAEVADVNARLLAAGDPRMLPDLERKARPATMVDGIGQVHLAVTEHLRLPDPEHPDRFLFPRVDAFGVRLPAEGKSAR